MRRQPSKDFLPWLIIGAGACVVATIAFFWLGAGGGASLATGVGINGKCADVGLKDLKPNKPGIVTINLCPGSFAEFTVAGSATGIRHSPRPGEPMATINWDANNRCPRTYTGYDVWFCRHNINNWRAVLWARGTYEMEEKWPAGLRLIVTRTLTNGN